MHRFFILVFCIVCFSFSALAQKKKRPRAFKLPNNISNSDKRKVEKATKLLNEGRLLDGERILVILRNENMNHAYFHEALVQIQKQILDRIAYEHPPSDEEGELFLQGNEITPDKNLEENFVDNGLARSTEEKQETVDNIRLSRRDRRALKKALKEKAETEEATNVENPIGAAKKEIDKINAAQRRADNAKKEQAKRDRKVAKQDGDLMLVPYDSYAQDIVNNSRLATLKHERVDSAAHYLRVLLIDTVAYDTLLNNDQLTLMEDGLDYFYAKDYIRASEKLKEIANQEPDYFPAHILLADCFYNLGLDTPTFDQMIYITQTFDARPEGFERLSRYYLAKGKFKEAAECILKAIMIYPEDCYFAQLNNILKRTGRKLNTQWVRREVYPVNSQKKYAEIIAGKKSIWRYYQNAETEVHSYATEKGVLRSNEITNEEYLEVYAWNEMLADHEIEIDTVIEDAKERTAYLTRLNLQKKDSISDEPIRFPFARAMQKMGYLDCYVFISLFHHDLYPAFQQFVLMNPDKVEKYFYILLNWEDEKFDKFRVEKKETDTKKSKKKKGRKKKSR